MVPFEKSRTVSFVSSIMKNISLFASCSRFPVKLVYCIAFGPPFSFCCLLKPIAISLSFYFLK